MLPMGTSPQLLRTLLTQNLGAMQQEQAPDNTMSPLDALRAQRAGLTPPIMPFATNGMPTMQPRNQEPMLEYPTAPTMVPAPVRDLVKETGRNALGAGLVGLLATITGNRGEGVNAMTGFLQGAKAAQNEAYGNQVNQWQVGQGQARQTYNDNVNRWGVQRSERLRQEQQAAREDAGAVARYKAQQGAYQGQANSLDKQIAEQEKRQPKPGDTLKEREGVFQLLKGSDAASQQQIMHALVESGDWKRLFGEDAPAKDEKTGMYSFSIKPAPPQRLAEDPAKVRRERVQKRIETLTKQFGDGHTTDSARRGIIAELQSIKKAAPDLYPGRVPALSDYRQFTPSEQVAINQREQSNRISQGHLALARERVQLQRSGKGANSAEGRALTARVKQQADWLKRVFMDHNTSDVQRANAADAMQALEKEFPGSVGFVPTDSNWGKGGRPSTATKPVYTLPNGRKVDPGVVSGSVAPMPVRNSPTMRIMKGKPGNVGKGKTAAPQPAANRPAPRSTPQPTRRVAPGKYGTITSIRKIND